MGRSASTKRVRLFGKCERAGRRSPSAEKATSRCGDAPTDPEGAAQPAWNGSARLASNRFFIGAVRGSLIADRSEKMLDLLSAVAIGLSNPAHAPNAPRGFWARLRRDPRFWLSMGLLAFILVGMGYVEYNRRYNFTPVDAHVTKVEKHCQVQTSKNVTNPMDCAAAQKLVQTAEFTGGETLWYEYYYFDYLSPVDGKIHHGNLAAKSDAKAISFKVGQVVKVRASKKDANKTMTF